MRWDKYLEAAAMSGLIAAVMAAATIFADGSISRTETFILLGAFVSGAAFYMKNHPNPLDPD